jgi:hypothetical protein
VIFLGGIGYTLTPMAGDAAGSVVTYAEPAGPAPVQPTPRLVVIGDSFSSTDHAGPAGWPVLVAAGHGLQLVNLASGGTGYVRAAASSFPYVAAAQLPGDATLVVVFGGYNDQETRPGDVEMAAHAVCAFVRRILPGAALLVVGPQWPRWQWGQPPASYLAIRDGVRAAALHADAAWADPLTERWFDGRPELIGPDGHHPTPTAGQQYLADQIAPHVAAVMLSAIEPEE